METYKLDNGLTVILNQDHNDTKVFGAVIIDGGGKRDPSDATGIAHYLEHLLFKGTTEMGTIDYETEKIYLDSINSSNYKKNISILNLQEKNKNISNDKILKECDAIVLDSTMLKIGQILKKLEGIEKPILINSY